jgi:hypothetical protein
VICLNAEMRRSPMEDWVEASVEAPPIYEGVSIGV